MGYFSYMLNGVSGYFYDYYVLKAETMNETTALTRLKDRKSWVID